MVVFWKQQIEYDFVHRQRWLPREKYFLLFERLQWNVKIKHYPNKLFINTKQSVWIVILCKKNFVLNFRNCKHSSRFWHYVYILNLLLLTTIVSIKWVVYRCFYYYWASYIISKEHQPTVESQLYHLSVDCLQYHVVKI